MLTDRIKPQVTKIITPLAKSFLKIGLTPDSITWIGTGLVLFGSFAFIANGSYFSGVLVVTIATLGDLFDGTMARLSNQGESKWGSFLDSTLDRISDSAILVALSLHLGKASDPLTIAVLILIPLGFLIPYIRAKAESLNIECRGGIAERTERLIILLLGLFLSSLGLKYSLDTAIWLLVILSVITVYQRFSLVWRATR